MDKDYKFISIYELKEWLINRQEHGNGIGFTFDIPTHVTGLSWEPTGWYGIYWSTMFDEYSLLVGYYGSGVLDCIPSFDIEEDMVGSIYKSFLSVASGECDYWEYAKISMNDKVLCVLVEEWDV